VRQRSPKPPDAHCSQTPAPFNPLYEAGDYAEAADRSRGAIEAYPEVAGAFFCIACCEAGRPRRRRASHLRHALERSERRRGLARRNPDLDSIRDRPEIAELLAG
jgi:hypothetical protein